MITFIRNLRDAGHIECSWYNNNKKRYRHEVCDTNFFNLGVIETDNKYGYMKYAIENNNHVIDNWVGEHPEYLETDVLDPNVMIKLDENSFRCECGGNVFAKLRSGKYRCNSCEALYEGE